MEPNTLSSLEQMTKESFKNRPEQADEAVAEYLSNLEGKELAKVRDQLLDTKYLTQFKTAITHTSLMVFIMALKATQSEISIDFDQYCREFLFFARNDDKLIYDMRMFYLYKLNADEMGIGDNANASKNTYNELLVKFTAQYKESKIHL